MYESFGRGNIGMDVQEYTLEGLMPQEYYDNCEFIFQHDILNYNNLSEMDDDEYENFLENLPDDIQALNLRREIIDEIRNSGCFEDIYAEDYLNQDFLDWLDEKYDDDDEEDEEENDEYKEDEDWLSRY